MYLETGNFWF